MTQILLHFGSVSHPFQQHTLEDHRLACSTVPIREGDSNPPSFSLPVSCSRFGGEGSFAERVSNVKDGRSDGVRGRPPAESSARGGAGSVAPSLRGDEVRRYRGMDERHRQQSFLYMQPHLVNVLILQLMQGSFCDMKLCKYFAAKYGPDHRLSLAGGVPLLSWPLLQLKPPHEHSL
ncbi:hypothetical protein CDAR_62361 [Caerostris darwini]|uniref:Uncharacterized protein n=1 Tax=Caerostris darwini TaxID=1538125 RepID=A0AAV4UEY6_9ARAC|nr:hypothetical protein CDAR_62361 [Caerostris darwini]